VARESGTIEYLACLVTEIASALNNRRKVSNWVTPLRPHGVSRLISGVNLPTHRAADQIG
jgi:hypothetical protein